MSSCPLSVREGEGPAVAFSWIRVEPSPMFDCPDNGPRCPLRFVILTLSVREGEGPAVALSWFRVETRFMFDRCENFPDKSQTLGKDALKFPEGTYEVSPGWSVAETWDSAQHEPKSRRDGRTTRIFMVSGGTHSMQDCGCFSGLRIRITSELPTTRELSATTLRDGISYGTIAGIHDPVAC